MSMARMSSTPPLRMKPGKKRRGKKGPKKGPVGYTPLAVRMMNGNC